MLSEACVFMATTAGEPWQWKCGRGIGGIKKGGGREGKGGKRR